MARLLRIVRVALDVCVVGPVGRRHRLRRRHSRTGQDVVGQSLLVDSVVDRLPHPDIVKGRCGGVELDEPIVQARPLLVGQIGSSLIDWIASGGTTTIMSTSPLRRAATRAVGSGIGRKTRVCRPGVDAPVARRCAPGLDLDTLFPDSRAERSGSVAPSAHCGIGTSWIAFGLMTAGVDIRKFHEGRVGAARVKLTVISSTASTLVSPARKKPEVLVSS